LQADARIRCSSEEHPHAPGSSILEQLTGASLLKWINVEAPKVSNRRVDLLGELPDGNLVHIELQSRNEKDFPLRMAEYLLGIRRKYGKLPRQAALYVGEAPLRMRDRFEGPGVSVHFHLVDIRDLDGAADGRDEALAELFIFAGLRKMEVQTRREARTMPILNDIMDNTVIGPAIRKGLRQGLRQGLQEGLQRGLEKGRVEGRTEILHRQIRKRFGRVPSTVAERIAALKPGELNRVAVRLLDAQRIEDLFTR
jgi:hypothetical protein